jgi:Cu-Zn family superoxide dismutase
MNRITILVLLAALTLLGGCSTGQAHAPRKAMCVLRGTNGNEGVTGYVSFTRVSAGILVEAQVSGLTPGDHGFHVHEWGDVNCTDGTCTGGHFNPHGYAHGGPDSEHRHVGDMGNLSAGPDGVARYRRADTVVSLDMDDPACIIGRAIIVHAGPDDLVSQPTGGAGARIASGVIGVAR